jgi:hypothetical protein
LRYRSGHPQTQCRAAGWRVQRPRLGYLFEQRNWLAGHHSSIAEITFGAYLSVLDYLGDVPWEVHPAAKLYYARLKSRPSFRPLLARPRPLPQARHPLRRPGFLSPANADCVVPIFPASGPNLIPGAAPPLSPSVQQLVDPKSPSVEACFATLGQRKLDEQMKPQIDVGRGRQGYAQARNCCHRRANPGAARRQGCRPRHLVG